jgi:hypothetical protein
MQTTTIEPAQQGVSDAVKEILTVLGQPQAEFQQEALNAFNNNDHATVKRLAATHLSDYYCKSLGYLGGALKLTPNTDTILAESARAAAEVVKERTLYQLSTAIADALTTS